MHLIADMARRPGIALAFLAVMLLPTTQGCTEEEAPFVSVMGKPRARDAAVEPPPDAGRSKTRTRMCGDVDCGLHGDCLLSDTGVASCTCDEGYVVTAGEPGPDGICVEDLDCLKARMLECRTGLNTSAVGLHFSLQYCSGRPYTELDTADIIVEEMGNQDFQELLPTESHATIVPSDPLMHVYVVIDVSNSIQDSNVLDDVADALKQFIDELVSMGSQYRFALFLFDGSTYLYPFIEDTGDLGDARQRLDELAQAAGDDPSSSNVYGAVIEGLDQLERAMSLRNLVSSLGTLNVGTLIVISDGDDRASIRTLDQVTQAISATPNNVLTVGLGDVADFPTLSSIGRDGSFSAATPSLLDQTFEQIAARIGVQRDSLYLVGYCSPKRTGTFASRVGIRERDLNRPTCSFSAAHFAGGSCDADSFKRDTACASVQCGGVIGCGDCPEGQCCAGGRCMAPVQISEDGKCGTEWNCSPGTTCVQSECVPAVAVGASCGTGKENSCDSGAAFCGSPDPEADPQPPKECLPALPLGTRCVTSAECETLHCAVPPNAPGSSIKVCLPKLQMFDACQTSPQGCEDGSYCDGGRCMPQHNAGQCDKNSGCKSGNCITLGSNEKTCGYPDTPAGGASCVFPLRL